MRALKTEDEVDKEKTVKKVRIDELELGMITDGNIRARDGTLLVSNDQEVTYLVLERLRNFPQTVGVIEPFRVKLSLR